MPDRVKQFFSLVYRYRHSANMLERKTILEKSIPALYTSTTSPRLRKQMARFLQENSKEEKTGIR